MDPHSTPLPPRGFSRLQDDFAQRQLAAWGLFNTLIIFWQLFLAPNITIIRMPDMPKFILGSVILFITVTLFKAYAPLRIPIFLFFVLGMQIWIIISTFAAQGELGRAWGFNQTDYAILAVILCFLQSALLSWFAPWTRVWMKWMVVGICVISGIVASLQWVGFGPAIQYANRMIAFEQIEDWGGRGGIRAVGIFPGIGLVGPYILMSIGLICGALFYRKLKWFEITICAFLIGVFLMVQVRNMLVPLALFLLPMAVLFTWRHRAAAVPYISLSILALMALILRGGERFAYMFSGDLSTFNYRQEVLWPQALSIYERRPWFGIGADPAFAGYRVIDDGFWSSGLVMDNGYLVALAYGGLPAVLLASLALIFALGGSIRNAVKHKQDEFQSGFALAAIAISLSFAWGMAFGNMWTNISYAMFFFVAAGLALPSCKKAIENWRGYQTVEPIKPAPAAPVALREPLDKAPDPAALPRE